MKNSVLKEEGLSLRSFDVSKETFVDNYILPIEQVGYSEHPLDAIEKCKNDPSRVPIVIRHNNKTVGFFVLHGWVGVQQYYDNEQAILLRAFSINLEDQGKGFGSKSMDEMPSFVRRYFPDVDEIILAVNLQNGIAQHIYRKQGYVDRGITAMGSKGLMNILHFDIKKA